MRLDPLAENPKPHAVKIDGRVVIAGDVAAIPPTGFNPLGLAEQA